METDAPPLEAPPPPAGIGITWATFGPKFEWLQKELAQRTALYLARVADGRMHQADADYHLQQLAGILDDYQDWGRRVGALPPAEEQIGLEL